MCNTRAMSASKPDLIGSREACAMLDVATSTLTRWAIDGTITPALKLPGRNGALLFHLADIEAIREARDKAPAA